MMNLFDLIGRVLIGGIFLWGAFEKIRHWSQSMHYMQSKAVPSAQIVLPIAVALKIIGGLSVLFGWHAHIGALILIVVATASVLKFHDFWTKEGNEYEVERRTFMKEVAVIGGLFLLLAMGSGRFGMN
ncbi:MAG: DoxX family protein [Chlamydiales bacterium]